jgi:hypothetical protein
MTSRFELQVIGRLPQGLTEAIGARFGAVAVHRQPGSTAVTGSVIDQAELRALLNLVWDTGADLLSLTLRGDDR